VEEDSRIAGVGEDYGGEDGRDLCGERWGDHGHKDGVTFRHIVCSFIGQTIKVFACDTEFRGKLACCGDSFAVLAASSHRHSASVMASGAAGTSAGPRPQDPDRSVRLIYLPFKQICAVEKD